MATLIAVVLAGYVAYVASVEHAARSARETADKQKTVSDCVSRANSGPAAERFFSSLTTILQNQIDASVVNAARPDTTPEQKQKLHDVTTRATQALIDIKAFETVTKSTTPSKEECDKLAKDLGVTSS